MEEHEYKIRLYNYPKSLTVIGQDEQDEIRLIIDDEESSDIYLTIEQAKLLLQWLKEEIET